MSMIDVPCFSDACRRYWAAAVQAENERVTKLAAMFVMSAEDKAHMINEAILAERERIIKLACEHCRAGHPMSMKHPMTHHDVPFPRGSKGYMMASCKAEEIRARTAQEEKETP